MAEPTANRTLRIRRLLGVAAAALVLAGCTALGWWWQGQIPFRRVEVRGASPARVAELAAVAAPAPGTRLYAVEPAAVAERLVRHPWVREARVTRFPTGTLSVRVTERLPVALVLDRRGRPSHFLDRDGYAMPAEAVPAADLPLLRGVREPYRAGAPVESARLRELLRALADAGAADLVSELVLRADGEVGLYAARGEGGGVIPVRLGREGFAPRLARLAAFWRQAVQVQDARRFESIDLRFEGQVVTREAAAPAGS